MHLLYHARVYTTQCDCSGCAVETQYLINIILSAVLLVFFSSFIRLQCTQINDKLNSLWHQAYLLLRLFDVCTSFLLFSAGCCVFFMSPIFLQTLFDVCDVLAFVSLLGIPFVAAAAAKSNAIFIANEILRQMRC